MSNPITWTGAMNVTAMRQEPKPDDTPTYSGVSAPDPTQAGTLQTGAWAVGGVQTGEILEALPANCRVQLSGSGVTNAAGSQTNQYKVILALGETLQLTASGADATNTRTSAVSPNSFVFWYRSRNVNVATVSSSGLVTAVGHGETEIIVTTPRNVNNPWGGASPSGTEGTTASLIVRVIP